MKIFKSKISIALVSCFCVLMLFIVIGLIFNINSNKPKAIKNKYKLEAIYNNTANDILYNIIYTFCFPFNLSADYRKTEVKYNSSYDSSYYDDGVIFNTAISTGNIESSSSSSNVTYSGGNNLDFSTTNVQVENVDEADIVKTDGQYIYSLSEDKVIISDVTDEDNPKIVNRIESEYGYAPEDIMIYGNKLVVINTNDSNNEMKIAIYNTTDKSNLSEIKSFEVNQRYYTSRMINGNLYVIANGTLKENANDEVIAYYEEDNSRVDIDLNKMYYFKDDHSDYETIIANIDLKEENSNFKVQAYISDIDNIYVSENNIYLVDQKYKYSDDDIIKYISRLFGINGVWGLIFDEEGTISVNDYVTSIIKLEIEEENGEVKYVARNEIEGEVINQFSFDEYNSKLRVALQNDDKGSKIVVFDENMKMIGESEYVGEDETMYSSRFIGDRAYLVTFKNTDPLFTFDLSDPTNPKVMGELKIPGYSTYLHPYDENHIIGIGINTEERIYRNSNGQVISTSTVINGLKMALFDVSDINNPIQISNVVIGDNRTKSAILENHKALLFSKEKELIAIPVNNYIEDEEETISNNSNISNLLSKYNSSSDEYISEGYIVYGINLDSGFIQKGVITHEEDYNSKYKSNQILRGVYIKDTLFTVSQHMLKVNNLNTLEEIASMDI